MSRISSVPLITILSAFSLASLPLGQVVHAQDANLRPDHFRWASDWPSEPATLQPVHLTKQLHDEARRQLRSAPTSASTVLWLLRTQMLDEVPTVLRRIVDEQPEQSAEAFGHLWTAYELEQAIPPIPTESSRQRRAQLEELLTYARGRLPSLPREAQAELAWGVRALDHLLGKADPTRRAEDEQASMRRFVEEYAGTRRAALVAVSLIAAAADRTGVLDTANRRENWRAASLAEYAAAHPGTEAAACALYSRAMNFAFGGTNESGRERVDSLVEVLRIVEELESGKFPRSSCTDTASMLLFEVRSYDEELSASDAERALAVLLPFLRARPGLATNPAITEQYLYLLESTLPTIGAQTRGGEGTTARVLDELRKVLPEPAIVPLAKAYRMLTPDDQGRVRAADGAIVRELEAAAGMGRGKWSRWAWISLAEHDISKGRITAARARYETYARRYPESDFAWMAAIRIGQIDYQQGKHEAAARIWLEAVRRYGGDIPVARAMGSLYAAQAFEATGALDRALDAYRDAVEALTPDVGEFADYGPSLTALTDLHAKPEMTPVRWERASIARRATELTATLALPGGRELERGRWLLEKRRTSEATVALEAVMKAHAGTPAATKARSLWHRARLETAIDLAAATRPRRDVGAALAALDALSAEPFDTTVGIAGIVGATLRHLHGPKADAETRMRDVLQRWVSDGTQSGPLPAGGTLEADALAIRDALFQPLGSGALGDSWNAFSFPKQMPAFVVAPATVTVKVAGAESASVDVSRQPRGLSNVIFIPLADIAFLSRLVLRVGGTAVREPQAIMEVPHQPIGDASTIVAWWNRFFPARAGHWGGFEVMTYPAFSSIEFLDAARTRALVPITIGYSGATAVLEKIDGVWTIARLVDVWVT